MVNMTLIRPLDKRQGYLLVPIDFLHTTSYAVDNNVCSRTHRLATVYSVRTDDGLTDDDDR